MLDSGTRHQLTKHLEEFPRKCKCDGTEVTRKPP